MVTAEQSICPKPYSPPRSANPPGKSVSGIIAACDTTALRQLLGQQQAALCCPLSCHPLTSRLCESCTWVGLDAHLRSVHPPQSQCFSPTGAGPVVPAEDAPLCLVRQEARGAPGRDRPLRGVSGRAGISPLPRHDQYVCTGLAVLTCGPGSGSKLEMTFSWEQQIGLTCS